MSKRCSNQSDSSDDSDWDDIVQEESLEAFKQRTLAASGGAKRSLPAQQHQQPPASANGYTDVGIEALLNSPAASLSSAAAASSRRLVDKVNQELERRGGSYLPKSSANADCENESSQQTTNRRRDAHEAFLHDEDDEDGGEGGNLTEFGRRVQKRIRLAEEEQSKRRRERLLDADELANAAAASGAAASGEPGEAQKPADDPLKAKRLAAVAALRADLSAGGSASCGRRPSSSDSDATVLSGTRLRISRVRVGSADWEHRMIGRRIVATSTVGNELSAALEKCKNDGVQGVLVGVLVGAVQLQKEQRSYSIWKLADLNRLGRQPALGLFLFGKVHDSLWKEASTGLALAVLQPRVLPPRNNAGGGRSSSEVSIAVDNPQQVMLLGKAVDFGLCGRPTKSGGGGIGGKCQNPVNVAECPVCEFHASQEYRRLSARRSDVSSTFVGVEPRRYRDQSMTSSSSTSSSSSMMPPAGHSSSVTFFKSRGGGSGSHESPGGAVNAASSRLFLLQGNSPGSRMLRQGLQQLAAACPQRQSSQASSATANSKPPAKAASALLPPLASANRRVGMPDPSSGTNLSFSEFAAGMTRDYKPQLGRGLPDSSSGSASSAAPSPAGAAMIDLDERPTGSTRPLLPKPTVMSVAEIAKLKAARRIAAAGGLDQLTMREQQRRQSELAARLERDEGSTSMATSLTPAEILDKAASPPESGSVVARTSPPPPPPPPRPRHRLLGDIDVDSPEFRRLMSQTSAHADLAAERVATEQDGYFKTLERREQLEEKLATVTERRVRVAECAECGVKLMQAPSENCKREGHRLVWSSAVKRAFKCKGCSQMTFTLDSRYPTEPCRRCGGQGYEKSSFAPQRKGPTLERDVLLTRGEERKFINQ